MDKTAIKNFAIWARNRLIADSVYKASLLGISEKGIADPLPQSAADVQLFAIGMKEPYAITGQAIGQRKELVEAIEEKQKDLGYEEAFQSVMEEAAYTWFNRLIAIRFMEINDYLPSHVRVLSSDNPAKTEPDFVTAPFDADFSFSEKEKHQIIRLKNENKMDDLFRLLFLKQCNALNESLPLLFEKISDYTELLLNLSITDREGIIWHLVHDIPEDNFDVNAIGEDGQPTGQLEIIGWLYQYYNTELKNKVFADLKKNIKITKETLPAATQLFTPDWIVRYMVENSLGRLWLEGHPNEELKSHWHYYLEEAAQEEEVQRQLNQIYAEHAKLKPEDLTCIDPCCGSGHILVYMFEVLMQIYRSQGYAERDAARSIVEHNLYGLDVDKRAAQLAYFSVMMKARQYDRRFLSRGIQPHIYAIEESNGLSKWQEFSGSDFGQMTLDQSYISQIDGLIDLFHDAKEYGSLLEVAQADYDKLQDYLETVRQKGLENILLSAWCDQTATRMPALIRQAKLLFKKYDIVVTNPPYMGSSGMDAELSEYVKENYPDSKSDLFAVFMERCGTMVKKNGYQAMITQHAWMFLSSYERLRGRLLCKKLVNLVHLGAHAFNEINGEVVQTASFVYCNSSSSHYKSTFIQLVDGKSEKEKEESFLSTKHCFQKTNDQIRKIKGAPYTSYWASDIVLSAFKTSHLVGDIAEPRVGMATANNDRFIRLWFEVDREKIGLNISSREEAYESKKKWFPFAKGGEQRKWYGNNNTVVNWEKDGFEIRNFKDKNTGRIRSHNYNLDYIFSSALTWTVIGTKKTSFRSCPVGFLYSNSGYGMFCNDEENKYNLIGFMNSKIAESLLKILSPSMGFESGYIRKLPIIESERKEEIIKNVKNCIHESNIEWDAFESSWDFQKHPLIQKEPTIEAAFTKWKTDCMSRFIQLKSYEEEINRVFIDIYDLRDELRPEEEDKDVTVRLANLSQDIESFISYAVGCMFGRYSLDVDGLAYAGGEWDSSKYQTFIPDADNVIPIADEEYLEDDIVGLFVKFVKVVYGEKSLEQNLTFIADALAGKGKSSREVIRNYFLKDFFKDHCKMYQKRPIYWLYDSGKQNGFKALVYLHRMDENTTGRVRADYLHRMEQIYTGEIARMQDTIDHSQSAHEVSVAEKRMEKLKKQVKECQDYDAKLGHLALDQIKLDLDDGVKVNYRKAQTSRDGKFYEVLADSKKIMAKDSLWKEYLTEWPHEED